MHTMPAPPRPSKAREAMIWGMDWARLDKSVPAEKSTYDACRHLLRPKMSLSLPYWRHLSAACVVDRGIGGLTKGCAADWART